jgi:hypothetical protein
MICDLGAHAVAWTLVDLADLSVPRVYQIRDGRR